MHWGWLTHLGLHRRWVVQTVLLAFAVPALLGLLPAPGATAASALERDLAASLCSNFGSGTPSGQEQHHPLHEDCILCAVCTTAAGPALAAGGQAFPGLPHTIAAVPPPLTALARPDPSLLLSGSPPRGPPSILQV
jgi:hypothetical protein